MLSLAVQVARGPFGAVPDALLEADGVRGQIDPPHELRQFTRVALIHRLLP